MLTGSASSAVNNYSLNVNSPSTSRKKKRKKRKGEEDVDGEDDEEMERVRRWAGGGRGRMAGRFGECNVLRPICCWLYLTWEVLFMM